jgi:hypothetical protein
MPERGSVTREPRPATNDLVRLKVKPVREAQGGCRQHLTRAALDCVLGLSGSQGQNPVDVASSATVSAGE